MDDLSGIFGLSNMWKNIALQQRQFTGLEGLSQMWKNIALQQQPNILKQLSMPIALAASIPTKEMNRFLQITEPLSPLFQSLPALYSKNAIENLVPKQPNWSTISGIGLQLSKLGGQFGQGSELDRMSKKISSILGLSYSSPWILDELKSRVGKSSLNLFDALYLDSYAAIAPTFENIEQIHLEEINNALDSNPELADELNQTIQVSENIIGESALDETEKQERLYNILFSFVAKLEEVAANTAGVTVLVWVILLIIASKFEHNQPLENPNIEFAKTIKNKPTAHLPKGNQTKSDKLLSDLLASAKFKKREGIVLSNAQLYPVNSTKPQPLRELIIDERLLVLKQKPGWYYVTCYNPKLCGWVKQQHIQLQISNGN